MPLQPPPWLAGVPCERDGATRAPSCCRRRRRWRGTADSAADVVDGASEDADAGGAEAEVAAAAGGEAPEQRAVAKAGLWPGNAEIRPSESRLLSPRPASSQPRGKKQKE